jgi:hypothetical protein
MRDDYAKMISGKQVVICGSGNKKVIPPSRTEQVIVASNGSRRFVCDVLYYNGGEFEPHNFYRMVKIYAWQSGGRGVANWCRSYGIPFELYATPIKGLNNPDHGSWWPVRCEEAAGTRPTAGMLMIYDALQYWPKEVFVTGMDFYRREDGTFPKTVGTHDMEKNYRFFKMLMDAHPARLVVDETLVEIMRLENPVFEDK